MPSASKGRCTDNLIQSFGGAEASWAGTDDKHIN
jgi:hypothetical protein